MNCLARGRTSTPQNRAKTVPFPPASVVTSADRVVSAIEFSESHLTIQIAEKSWGTRLLLRADMDRFASASVPRGQV